MQKVKLRVAHLYGNLLNTYGDNGNILVLNYLANKMNISLEVTVVSIHEPFKSKDYDFVFFGGGQDYEQKIISNDLKTKRAELIKYIENDGVMLAICGGYQLLGEYYMTANGERVEGVHILDHYTIHQEDKRFIGEIQIFNEEFNETYIGFENHNGKTYLGNGERALGKVIVGYGNNGEDQSEGVIYLNVFGSYLHGPILARNPHLAQRILNKIIEVKNTTPRF